MIKKALVVAPHPDDEINLAGQFIITLLKKKIEVYVAYTTNGDVERKIGNKRIQEAINANAVLGVHSDHVIFLGYPNEWKDNTHVYNAYLDELLVSKLGKTETNSINDYPEYCFQKYGVHHKFTRSNFKNDLKDLIVSLLPDLFIVPEFDSHPDHRAASLMFDEIIGEILKEKVHYKPLVLKKYIHEGVWNGPKDYYKRPAMPTVHQGAKKYAGQFHELESPAFRWDQRIRLRVDDATLTDLLKDNIIYKAAKKHKVTTAWYETLRVINADVVYWKRRVDNEALHAVIEVSSGDAKFLNDFKYYDTDNIYSKEDMFQNSKEFCWQPELTDAEKKIVCRFDAEKCIKSILLVEDCNAENHITSLMIKTKSFSEKIEMNCDGSCTEITFPDNIMTDCLELIIVDYSGQPGIAELEIFSTIDEDVPFQKYMDNEFSAPKSHIHSSQIIEMLFFKIKFLLTFKIKYEINRLISQISVLFFF